MNLEIPIKLEGYVDEIKKQTVYLENTKKLTILQLGKTSKVDNQKIMLLLYNPFPISLYIDCNFFTKDSKVFKMYPSSFTIQPRSAFAFVVFCTSDGQIQIDGTRFENNIESNISNRLYKYLKEEEGIKSNKFINVQPLEYENFETQLLPDHIAIEEFEYVTYKPKYEKSIDVKLLAIDELDDSAKLTLRVINLNDSLNFEITSLRIKLFDRKHKLIIPVKNNMKIKCMSSKDLNVVISLQDFKYIDLDQVEMKITII